MVRGDTVDQDVRCLLMDSRANMQAFFATQVEALVYFMVVILQCAPLSSWRALAGLWFCCMQVSSVCWVGVRIPLHPVAKVQQR